MQCKISQTVCSWFVLLRYFCEIHNKENNLGEYFCLFFCVFLSSRGNANCATEISKLLEYLWGERHLPHPPGSSALAHEGERSMQKAVKQQKLKKNDK